MRGLVGGLVLLAWTGGISFAQPDSGQGEPVTKVRPEVIYRQSLLSRRKSAVFHRPNEDKDTVDQVYATLRFDSSWEYEDAAVFEAGIRTPRSAPNGEIELVMHQAFIESQLAGGRLILTAGKKVEFDGPGILMNPSDLLNEDKDLIDPLYQREGKVFTRLMLTGAVGKVGLGYIPKRAAFAGEGKAWLQGQTQIAGGDFRLQATMQSENKATTGFSVSRFFASDRLELHLDGRYQARQRSVNEQRERAYSVFKNRDPSAFVLAGGRFVVKGKRSATVEVMQNQSGLDREEFKSFFAAIDALDEGNNDKKPDSRFLGRNYAFLAFHDEDSLPRSRLSASVLLNATDKSTFGSIELRHSVSPLIALSVNPLFFSGAKDSEFGEMPFKTIMFFQATGRI
jgi:hypothetical protein